MSENNLRNLEFTTDGATIKLGKGTATTDLVARINRAGGTTTVTEDGETVVVQIDLADREKILRLLNGEIVFPMTVEEAREAAENFANAELTPEVIKKAESEKRFPLELWGKFGEAGLLGITIPLERGGMGIGFEHHVAIMEVFSRIAGGIALSWGACSDLGVANVFRNATDEQIARLTQDMMSGKRPSGVAMTEPQAGSSVIEDMESRAEKVNGGWILNGSKTFITNARDVKEMDGVLIVYVKTPSSDGSSKLTAFLVEGKMEGFTIGQDLHKMGMHSSNTALMYLSDCFVPDENVLGEVGEGAMILKNGLDKERLVLAGGPLGLAEEALERAAKYANTRKSNGRPIGDIGAVQQMLGKARAELAAAKAIVYQAARDTDQGRGNFVTSTEALYVATKMAIKVTDIAIQVMGGNGYMEEYEVERMYRDAKLYEIGAGTQQVRLGLLAKDLLKRQKV